MLWLFDAHALFDLGDFLLGDRRWRGVCADKPGDAWRIANDVPSFVGQFHFNQCIALEDLVFNNFALAVFNLNLLFFWYHDVKDLVGHVYCVNTLTDTISYLFFVAAIGVNRVPLSR